MSIRLRDLTPLSAGLPPLVALCDFPYGPVDRIVSQLIDAGVEVSIINLTTRIKAQSEYHKLGAYRHVCGDEQKNFQKLKVFQTLFEKKHTALDKSYDVYFFNFDLSLPLQQMELVRNAGIFFIGILHGLYPLQRLPGLLENKAGIMRLSTTQPLSGYCLHTAGCRKWQTTGCAHCPQLGLTTFGRDECEEYFEKKLNAFANSHCNLTVVTPSRWLEEEAQKSLIGKHLPCTSIITSVELDHFRPHDQTSARRALGLPEDRDILLIGSAGLRRNKGFQVLARALSLLAGRWKKPPLLLTFGYAPEDTSLLEEAGIPWKALGWVGDPTQLAQAYSAADVFVSPSFQDNLPNTANEALACGTPVVCFDRYSSEEVVIDGVTGLTARHPGLPLSPDGELLQQEPYQPAPEACADLAGKILSLLRLSEDGRRTLRANCRTFAERAFSPTLQAARYLCTYRKLLGLSAMDVPGLEEDVTAPATGLTKLDL